MKIRILTVLSLAVFMFLVGCRGAANTNMTANGNMMNSNSMTNTMSTASDSVAATAVKDAMQKAGFNNVMVTATTTEVTLRGTVPKGKLGEAVRIANETGKRRVSNELSEK